MPWSLDGNSADFTGSLKAGQLFSAAPLGAGGQGFRAGEWAYHWLCSFASVALDYAAFHGSKL